MVINRTIKCLTTEHTRQFHFSHPVPTMNKIMNFHVNRTISILIKLYKKKQPKGRCKVIRGMIGCLLCFTASRPDIIKC